ncbi:hypothetical protein OOK31_16500 [Streptomyces sp. NBC_00249]|uniref:hypothetical protein n=1 Tax=Streptomyces sp. NBC_00249 TaxID=2975690 RepID=UPI00225807D7|nr:hypothetical protein [Streptomyces sp. NBC_00249]MCX5195485.1 hypothetical protein [Streptomyces sp. NBC_00249]
MTGAEGAGAEGADAELIGAAEADRIREAVASAVLGASEGLAASLEHDAEGYLRLVAAARIGAEESSRLLREAIQGARAAGHSWDAVGGVLGVSRQAAQQRFAVKQPSGPTGAGDGPERREITPVTAFTEMAALDEAGKDGWHLVDYGSFRLVVEASEHTWEHRRAVGGHRRLAAEGWTRVGPGSFPWSYYKRRCDPAS